MPFVRETLQKILYGPWILECYLYLVPIQWSSSHNFCFSSVRIVLIIALLSFVWLAFLLLIQCSIFTRNPLPQTASSSFTFKIKIKIKSQNFLTKKNYKLIQKIKEKILKVNFNNPPKLKNKKKKKQIVQFKKKKIIFRAKVVQKP